MPVEPLYSPEPALAAGSSEHRIYPEHSLGVARLQGSVTVDSLSSGITGLYSDERWQRGYATLWDLSGITELILSPDDMTEILALLRGLGDVRGGGLVAFVVGRELDWEVFSLFVYKDSPVSKRASGMFWEMQEALAWLGVHNLPPAAA